MNRIITLCSLEIKRVFLQPRSWILMFLMPVIFTFIFGGLSSGGTSKLPIAVVDQDASAVSKWVVQQIAKDGTLDVQAMIDAEAEQALRDRKVAGVLQIPASYEATIASGGGVDIVFRHGPDLAIAPTISMLVEDASSQAVVQVKAAQALSQVGGSTDWKKQFDRLAAKSSEPKATVEVKSVTKEGAREQMEYQSERSIGFSIMFVMMSLLSVTGKILEARKTGVWYRLLSTPTSRLQVLGGYLLAFFLIGWIQFAILMGLSSLLFGVQWGDMIGQIVLVSALLFCVVGLGLFLAGIVKTQEQQGAIGTIVIISTCMLGGVYWPLDIVSDTMRTIANFVPQSWAMTGFTELIARGGTVADILMPVAVLVAFGAVFLFVGMTRVKYE
ncbi:ABC transporter permease [Tumebacillus lipolyticus]|uniref:ABC transporter permease n=1 Tax=Tumebacillus lipolyticus TaxID=1280370 RepID=A0ABW4ZWZ7_9BACL